MENQEQKFSRKRRVLMDTHIFQVLPLIEMYHQKDLHSESPLFLTVLTTVVIIYGNYFVLHY